ncbi:hypothetical protein ACSBR2_031635 [Camellia fascicularis]
MYSLVEFTRVVHAVDIIIAQDGSENFTTITDAILATPNYSARRYYIKIKEGLYRENIFVGIEKNKSYTSWRWDR